MNILQLISSITFVASYIIQGKVPDVDKKTFIDQFVLTRFCLYRDVISDLLVSSYLLEPFELKLDQEMKNLKKMYHEAKKERAKIISESSKASKPNDEAEAEFKKLVIFTLNEFMERYLALLEEIIFVCNTTKRASKNFNWKSFDSVAVNFENYYISLFNIYIELADKLRSCIQLKYDIGFDTMSLEEVAKFIKNFTKQQEKYFKRAMRHKQKLTGNLFIGLQSEIQTSTKKNSDALIRQLELNITEFLYNVITKNQAYPTRSDCIKDEEFFCHTFPKILCAVFTWYIYNDQSFEPVKQRRIFELIDHVFECCHSIMEDKPDNEYVQSTMSKIVNTLSLIQTVFDKEFSLTQFISNKLEALKQELSWISVENTTKAICARYRIKYIFPENITQQTTSNDCQEGCENSSSEISCKGECPHRKNKYVEESGEATHDNELSTNNETLAPEENPAVKNSKINVGDVKKIQVQA